MARTPEARLAARLFDYDQVVSIFLKDKALDFYEEVEEEWRWNSRYWEQVALLNLAKYQSDKVAHDAVDYLHTAIAHARHAVSVEQHPLTLTTLGKIQMVSALSGTELDEFTFVEAVSNLREAMKVEKRRSRLSVQPYMVLFNSLLQVNDDSVINEGTWENVRDSMAVATRAFKRDTEIQAALVALAERFPQVA